MNRKNKKSLKLKHELSKEAFKNQYGVKKMMSKFSMSESEAKHFKKNLAAFMSLDSDDETLNTRFKMSKVEERYADIDQYLLGKIEKLRANNLSINYDVLRSLAEKYFKEFDVGDKSTVSQYFLKTFVKRNNLKYLTLHGEAASADPSQLHEFKQKLLEKTEIYGLADIFNIDETGTYIKKISNKSFVLDRGADNRHIKTEKTRISVLIGCNPYGEKLTTLVIGKSKNPRCFKGVDMEGLNVLYRSNKTSWLTAEIFNEYCEILNEKLKIRSRRILIILDNFRGHAISNKSNIEFLFLPPNTTAISQPLDMGIINAFLSCYRRYLNNFLISMTLDEDMTYKDALKKTDLVYVLKWIESSVDNITPETIYNCWRKADILDSMRNVGASSNHIEDEIKTEVESEVDNENEGLDIDEIVGTSKSSKPQITRRDFLKHILAAREYLNDTKLPMLDKFSDLEDEIYAYYADKYEKGTLDGLLRKKN